MKASKASTVGLNTRLEEDFISPLTAVRGALEILRDYPDLSAPERMRFVHSALRECERLQGGVMRLSEAVYAAGTEASSQPAPPVPATPASAPTTDTAPYADRIHDLPQDDVVEVDFSGFVFRNSHTVNAFYDALEAHIRRLGKKVWLLVNYTGCSIWPEAWVGFAHRAKKINVNFVAQTVRYSTDEAEAAGRDRDMFESRDLALGHIREVSAKGSNAPLA